MTKEQIMTSNMIDAYKENIEKRKREIKMLEDEINKLQTIHKHELVVCLDKRSLIFGNDIYENNEYECIICGKRLDHVTSKNKVIDVTRLYKDIKNDDKRKEYRREYVKNIMLAYQDCDTDTIYDEMNKGINKQLLKTNKN